MTYAARQKIAAEVIGSALLLATVVGSGIMAETLADGNIAVALLANTSATGAILDVLITALGPVSGAHFNPAVTLVFLLRKELPARLAAAYVLAQLAGTIAGVGCFLNNAFGNDRLGFAAIVIIDIDVISSQIGHQQFFSIGLKHRRVHMRPFLVTVRARTCILNGLRHRPQRKLRSEYRRI